MREAKYPMYTNREKFTSVREVFDRALKLYPDNYGCKYQKNAKIVSVTYKEIYSDIQKIGSYLYERCGYARDKAAFVSNSIYPWYVTYISALYYGCTIVPLDQSLNAEDLAKQIDFTDVTTLFFNLKNKDKIQKIKQLLNKDIEYICLDSETDFSDSYSAIMQRQKIIASPTPINGDDLAEIVFTSGDTIISKGVMISHYNIASNLMFCTNVLDLSEKDDLESFLPNNHLYFLSTGLLLTMYFGSAVCLNRSVFSLMSDMNKYKPSIVLMVPAILQLLKREITSRMKGENFDCLNENSEKAVILRNKIRELIGGNINTVVSGGAFLDKETMDFYKLIGIEVLNGYGITECSPLVSCSVQRRSKSDKVGTVGLIGTCCDVKIIDDEVCVSGANVMLGYYKNPELTAETIVDGWLKTGDLGRIDEDGYLYITGRKKNLIILSNGENVCPDELEKKIHSIEGVKKARVYEENNLITADVLFDQNVFESKNISFPEEYIKQNITEINLQLPTFKRIKNIKVKKSDI